MITSNILGIPVGNRSKSDTLENIRKYLASPDHFFHVVSLNPEIFVLTSENEEFKKVVVTAQSKLIDGIGVVLAGRLLGVPLGGRVSGVDMMKELITIAQEMRLRVLLIGGKGNLALELSECYGRSYPQAIFKGIEGFADVKNPTKGEIEIVSSIVTDYMPQIVLVAFGSPWQELFLERHRNLFKKSLCMGVGGAFDFLSGKVPRAAKWIRSLGLEWLFRLIIQPWRWRRQTRLFKFIFLVLKQKFSPEKG